LGWKKRMKEADGFSTEVEEDPAVWAKIHGKADELTWEKRIEKSISRRMLA
jgi:hypothetical protein